MRAESPRNPGRFTSLGALAIGLRLIRKSRVVRTERVILLGLFFAFGAELATGIIADFADLGFGNNLQVRFFTYYGLFAAPLFVLSADWVVVTLRRWLPRSTIRIGVTAMIFIFAVSSLLKATLDPLISNNWIYFHPSEIAAIETRADHSERRPIYMGGRVWSAWIMTDHSGLPNNNFPDEGIVDSRTAHVLFSQIQKAHASTGWIFLSPITEQNRLYDNGIAWIYHRIPLSHLQK